MRDVAIYIGWEDKESASRSAYVLLPERDPPVIRMIRFTMMFFSFLVQRYGYYSYFCRHEPE